MLEIGIATRLLLGAEISNSADDNNKKKYASLMVAYYALRIEFSASRKGEFLNKFVEKALKFDPNNANPMIALLRRMTGDYDESRSGKIHFLTSDRIKEIDPNCPQAK